MFVGFLFGGPEKSAGQVACVAGGFLACFYFMVRKGRES